MTRRGDLYLAPRNVGPLVAETGEPRVAEFRAAPDRVNGIGRRSPGFVRRMEGSGAPGAGTGMTDEASSLILDSVRKSERTLGDMRHDLHGMREERRGVIGDCRSLTGDRPS